MTEKTIPLALGIWFLVLFAAESFFPLRTRKRPLASRFMVNFFLVAASLLTAAAVLAPVIEECLLLAAERGIGILNWIQMPPMLRIALGVLLLDLSFYYWHRINHKTPLLWRFHNVHHIDQDMDSTTSFRFHFGETAYSAVFRAAQILLIGPQAETLLIYGAAFSAATLFHHSNLRLPSFLDRALARVIVTPRMHGVHHSDYMEETDSNYSVIFSFWDAIHRTLRLDIPQEDVNIGVPGYADKSDNTVVSTMLMPFVKQKRYWRRPDGSPAIRR